MQERLIARAKALLEDGTVSRVIGWKRGDFPYETTPAVFTSAEEIEREFVFDDFCGPNLAKFTFLHQKAGEKTLVFLKPCDTYSVNQLLTEHRLDREALYLIGVPCDGMLDIGLAKDAGAAGILSAESDGKTVRVKTLYGEKTFTRDELIARRCRSCKSGRHVIYDELLGEEGDLTGADRFDEVKKLEAMTPEERFAFWRGELSRCIRCNACRNACPACTCETCVFDRPDSGVSQKVAADSFEENMFHIIRAFHVAGRCTDCGECSRVCPEHIPLHLLNRKFISDINEFYGEYQAGETVGQRSPLTDYQKDDPEPSADAKGGAFHA